MLPIVGFYAEGRSVVGQSTPRGLGSREGYCADHNLRPIEEGLHTPLRSHRGSNRSGCKWHAPGCQETLARNHREGGERGEVGRNWGEARSATA